ncbi:MAG: DUF4412 domain-containing protein [Deltaproteobacteria bacterium]|nr:DUF4412 domain-containing protein [Deltaproteobacteria bacterium]
MRRGRIFLAACLAAAVVLTGGLHRAARAAGFAEPKVEYSADQYMGVEDKVIKSKVYHAPGKERMDMDLGEAKQYVITRRDKKLSWIVMPDQKMYIEMSLEEGKKGPERQARAINECSVTQKAAGKETVNGVSTTRGDIDMSCPDGTRFSGSMWTTKEGILVKLDAAAKEGSGKKGRLTIELKNLKIGKLDPKVFQVPAGYRQMKTPGGMIPGLGGIDGKEMMRGPGPGPTPRPAAPSDTGRSYTSQPRDTGRSYTAEPRATQPEAAPQKEKGTIDKVLDPVKKLKGLFGR